MTNYYFKGSPIVAPLTVTSEEPAFVGDSISLRRTVASQKSQRWRLTFSVQPDIEKAGALFVDAVTTANDKSTMTMPQLVDVAKNLSVNGASLTASGAAGDGSVTITGTAGTIPAGTFIQFSDHDKIYVVTADFSSGSMSVFPTLRQAVSGSVYYPGFSTEPTLSYWKDEEEVKGVTYEDGILAGLYQLSILEAL